VQEAGSTDAPVERLFHITNGTIIASNMNGMMKSYSDPDVTEDSQVFFFSLGQDDKAPPGPFCAQVSSDYSTSLE
jgi:hypothetical protein